MGNCKIKELVRRWKSVHGTDKIDDIIIGSGTVLCGIHLDKELTGDLHNTFKGMYTKKDNQKYIYYNNDMDMNEQKVVLCHEFAHANLHSDLNVHFLDNRSLFNVGKYERQANSLCAEYFISDSFIEEYKYWSENSVAGYLGVPVELVKLKLANYDMSKLTGYDDIIP